MPASFAASDDDLWVFGYGSLMWRPGFNFEDRHVAHVVGYRRRLCIYSHVYRGTPERPGLVLGLDHGGDCFGVAFRVAPWNWSTTLAYLRERELVTDVYLEDTIDAALDNGARVKALTYVADPKHPQFAPPMEPDVLLALVRQGHGISGANVDYVVNTYQHLQELGIHDAELAFLVQRLG